MSRAVLLAALVCAGAAAQPLKDRVNERIASFPGTVSLYAKNLDTGVAIGIRESDPVRTASTIKLPITLAVFDSVARGKAKWTDQLTVTAADKVSGSGVIGSEISVGVQLPLRDVLHLMIVLSDNSATNMIIEKFTADAVNAYLDKIGITSTRSLRKIRGDKAPTVGRQPESFPRIRNTDWEFRLRATWSPFSNGCTRARSSAQTRRER